MLKKTFLAQSLAGLASKGPAFGNTKLKTLTIFIFDKAEPLASPAP
ncbi:hypothetical protein [Bradyrhizobium liaoningense]